MTVALTTPAGELTAALRLARVPDVAILAADLTLRGIYGLGRVAQEMLCALRLRSVGRNGQKAGSMGGVGGTLLLKANDSAELTYQAMRYRGFEGEYVVPARSPWRPADLAWFGGLALLAALFLRLEGWL